MEKHDFNLENFKNNWNNQSGNELNLDQKMELYNASLNPIDKVRKLMKQEFFVQIITMVFIGFVPFYFHLNSDKLTVFYFFYSVAVGFTLYYFQMFYQFYKKSYTLSYNSLKNLTWFKYELKLSIELYKALTYMILIIFFGYAVINKGLFQSYEYWSDSSFIKPYFIFFLFLLSFLFIYKMTVFWVNKTYNKYLNHIQNVLDQLEEN
ncbi:MAG: hypothetical protein IPL95_09165 [Saprospiraceae bacterium]|nr:hypothetical protein [Saprospiraceae bacterium]